MPWCHAVSSRARAAAWEWCPGRHAAPCESLHGVHGVPRADRHRTATAPYHHAPPPARCVGRAAAPAGDWQSAGHPLFTTASEQPAEVVPPPWSGRGRGGDGGDGELMQEIRATRHVGNLRKLLATCRRDLGPRHYRAALSQLSALVDSSLPMHEAHSSSILNSDLMDAQHAAMVAEVAATGLAAAAAAGRLRPGVAAGAALVLARLRHCDAAAMRAIARAAVSPSSLVDVTPWHASGLLLGYARLHVVCGLVVDPVFVERLLGRMGDGDGGHGWDACGAADVARALTAAAMLRTRTDAQQHAAQHPHPHHATPGAGSAWAVGALASLRTRLHLLPPATVPSVVRAASLLHGAHPGHDWLHAALMAPWCVTPVSAAGGGDGGGRVVSTTAARDAATLLHSLARLRHRPDTVWLDTLLNSVDNGATAGSPLEGGASGSASTSASASAVPGVSARTHARASASAAAAPPVGDAAALARSLAALRYRPPHEWAVRFADRAVGQMEAVAARAGAAAGGDGGLAGAAARAASPLRGGYSRGGGGDAAAACAAAAARAAPCLLASLGSLRLQLGRARCARLLAAAAALLPWARGTDVASLLRAPRALRTRPPPGWASAVQGALSGQRLRSLDATGCVVALDALASQRRASVDDAQVDDALVRALWQRLGALCAGFAMPPPLPGGRPGACVVLLAAARLELHVPDAQLARLLKCVGTQLEGLPLGQLADTCWAWCRVAQLTGRRDLLLADPDPASAPYDGRPLSAPRGNPREGVGGHAHAVTHARAQLLLPRLLALSHAHLERHLSPHSSQHQATPVQLVRLATGLAVAGARPPGGWLAAHEAAALRMLRSGVLEPAQARALLRAYARMRHPPRRLAHAMSLMSLSGVARSMEE
ncbi:hypothetical protein FOA52_006316 [Chlamydomonas sp. UWO 241]|nr:hypothetical protein FOA52_006316 [Chlamydomonas sp. UWO 241]